MGFSWGKLSIGHPLGRRTEALAANYGKTFYLGGHPLGARWREQPQTMGWSYGGSQIVERRDSLGFGPVGVPWLWEDQ